MNSVSRVACIKAAKVYDDRELKAVKRDEETFVNKCVRMMVSKGGWPAGDDRLVAADELEGMVVEISVWTSTRVSIALYTYGRTCSGRGTVGSQSGAVMPSTIVVFNLLMAGLVYDWNKRSSI